MTRLSAPILIGSSGQAALSFISAVKGRVRLKRSVGAATHHQHTSYQEYQENRRLHWVGRGRLRYRRNYKELEHERIKPRANSPTASRMAERVCETSHVRPSLCDRWPPSGNKQGLRPDHQDRLAALEAQHTDERLQDSASRHYPPLVGCLDASPWYGWWLVASPWCPASVGASPLCLWWLDEQDQSPSRRLRRQAGKRSPNPWERHRWWNGSAAWRSRESGWRPLRPGGRSEALRRCA